MAPRKAPWEYSTNKNTVRTRARKSKLSDYQRTVEQAKASDAKAVSRAWKVRAVTETFRMASENGRKTILESVETEVMGRRREKGIDAGSKIDRFMQRMDQTGGAPPAVATSNVPNETPAIPMTSGPGFAQDSMLMSSPRRASISMTVPTALGPFPHSPQSLFSRPRPTTPAPVPYQNDQNDDVGHRLRSIPRLGRSFPFHYGQRGLGGTKTDNANLQHEQDATREQIRDLRRQTDALRNDILVARSSLLAQEARLEELVGRIANSEHAGGFCQVVVGVHAMVDAAIKVITALEGSSKNLHHANQAPNDAVKPDLALDVIPMHSGGDD